MKRFRSRPSVTNLGMLAATVLALHSSIAVAHGDLVIMHGSAGRSKLAVFGVNQAGPAHDGLSRELTSVVKAQLAHLSNFAVVNATTSEAGPVAILNAAKSAGADAALVVKLIRVGTSPAAVEVQSETWSLASQHITAETYALSRSDRLPRGQGYSGIAQLIGAAAAETVEQLSEATQLRGIVISRPEAGQVRISLGGLQHVRNGARVQFGTGDTIIGGGEVIELDDAQALVQVKPRFAFQRVEVNTPVVVVYNPPLYAAGRSVKEQLLRAERVDDIQFASALTIAVLGTFVFKGAIIRSFYK